MLGLLALSQVARRRGFMGVTPLAVGGGLTLICETKENTRLAFRIVLLKVRLFNYT